MFNPISVANARNYALLDDLHSKSCTSSTDRSMDVVWSGGIYGRFLYGMPYMAWDVMTRGQCSTPYLLPNARNYAVPDNRHSKSMISCTERSIDVAYTFTTPGMFLYGMPYMVWDVMTRGQCSTPYLLPNSRN